LRKTLTIFCIIYSTISFCLLKEIPKGEHGHLYFIPILFIFWILSLILLVLIYRNNRTEDKPKWTNLLLTLCTPIPAVIILIFWYIWTINFEFKATVKYYKSNNLCKKEVDYIFKKKKEYWSNYDSPENEYRLDSIVYYDEDLKQYKTDIYKDWERIKGDGEKANCNINLNNTHK